MEIILTLVVIFILLGSFILPWINRSSIKTLFKEIQELKNQLHNVNQNSASPSLSNPRSSIKFSTIYTENPSINSATETIEYSVPNSQTQNNKKDSVSFEQQFGARLPVWIGGVALALAGFFMVKYSIEKSLISPALRVVIGFIFGAGMIFTASWLRKKPQFANGTRITQALSGAGIADLYVCVFAATSLNLVPNFIGFVAMAAITAIAVFLSLKHGMPIALLGLIGGFLTPAIMGSNNPQAPMLFIYLYFVFAGLMIVIQKKCWWPIATLAVFGSFIWVLLWLFGAYCIPSDTIWLGFFLIAVSATVVFLSKEQYKHVDTKNQLCSVSIMTYLTLSGTILITGIIAARLGFGVMEWGLFGFLSIGGIILAYFKQQIYGFVPCLSMIMVAVMLIIWTDYEINNFAITISLFAALYITSGYLLQFRSEKPLIWAGLTSATAIIYYLLGYYELRDSTLLGGNSWSILALVLSGLSVYALDKTIKTISAKHIQKQKITAIYAATATAFLSIALALEVPKDFLPIALSAQLFAIAWINNKMDIGALRGIVFILALVFLFLLFPQAMLLLKLVLQSLSKTTFDLQKLTIFSMPMLKLGIPALFFAASSYLLRLQKDDSLVRLLEISAITLVTVMAYYLVKYVFYIDKNLTFIKFGFIERGFITNIIFVHGILCLWLGKRFARPTISLSGLVLSGIAVFRIIYFDLFYYNPLWSSQAVGSMPIFNALLLAYGLPVIWMWKITQELSFLNKPKLSKYGYVLMLLFSFVFISFNVCQMFRGTFLNGPITSNAEIYTYSVVWLVFGVALLILGTLRKDKIIRVASLVIMILTVGKVFLYDASELEGLYRVFSFFGLGVCLLSLSWFYTRFIFTKQQS